MAGQEDRDKMANVPHRNNDADLVKLLTEKPGVMLVGRSLFPEYAKMFDLDPNKLPKDIKILDVAGGVASFASEMHALGFENVHAADPLYRLPTHEIIPQAEVFLKDWEKMFDDQTESYDLDGESPAWLVANPLPEIDTPAKLLAMRLSGLKLFEESRDAKGDSVYIPSELPSLSGVNEQYDLILCGNYLMAYTRDDVDKTVASLESMISKLTPNGEIRIYPGGTAFKEAESQISQALFTKGYTFEKRASEHTFVVGWDQMYVITSGTL